VAQGKPCLDPSDFDRMVSWLIVGMWPRNTLLGPILLFIAFRWFALLPETDSWRRSAIISLL
jgi:hypothetical protein